MAGLSVLGADRFRFLSAVETCHKTGKGGGRSREGLPLSRTLGQRLSSGGGQGAEATTPGLRPGVADGKSSEKGPQASAQGLGALSLRLSSNRLQDRLAAEPLGAGSTVSAVQEVRLVADGPLPGSDGDAEMEQENPIALSERCGRAFGEVFAKRAKAGHPLNRDGAGLTGEAAPLELAIVPVGEGFKRGRLAEWMELAVQHAPPAMKQQRAVPGGMQDAYLRAVRSYLTGCSLAARQEADADHCKSRTAVEEALVFIVSEVHPGQEGTLLSVEVAVLPSVAGAADASAAAGLAVGAPARLLLHHRHPALTAGLDVCGTSDCSWPPSAGAKVLVRGFQVVVAASSSPSRGQSRGVMLMPLEMEVLK